MQTVKPKKCLNSLRKMKRFLFTLLISAVFVFAQSGFSFTSSGIHVPGARTLSPGDLFILGGFEMASSNKPASLEGYLVDENGNQRKLTPSPSNTVLGFIGYGILDFLDVGLNINVHYDGDAGGTRLKGLGFGDLGLMVKAQLPNQSLRDLFNFAAGLEVFIPSGTNEKGLRPRHLWYIHKGGYTNAYSAADFAIAGTLYMTINIHRNLNWNNYAGVLRTIENGENIFIWGTGLNIFPYEWVSLVLETSGETWIRAKDIFPGFLNDQLRFSPGLKVRLPKFTTLSINADLGMDLFRKRKLRHGHAITTKNKGHEYSYTVPGSSPITASIKLSRTFDLSGRIEDFKKKMDACPKSGLTFKENKYRCAPDDDNDGIANDLDKCPDTPEEVLIDENGCPFDHDNDGIPDYKDKCPQTKEGYPVDENGCIRDDDNDGIPNELDKCPDSEPGEEVNERGCILDTDEDGVPNVLDSCPNTPAGLTVNKYGCFLDKDEDGVPDEWDKCPESAPKEIVNMYGCPIDSDEDGIPDFMDKCINTPLGVKVDSIGCRIDQDLDGVFDEEDKCLDTPENAPVDNKGCPLDSDKDGIFDYLDNCPNTLERTEVDANGCPIRDKLNLDKIARRITFLKGTDKPMNSSYTALSDIVSIMRHNKHIAIEIQCSVKPGEALVPQSLSEARATVIYEFLINKGIKEERLKATGFGTQLPADTRGHTKLNPVGVRLLPYNIKEE